MTIDEAIEALRNEYCRTWSDGVPRVRDAVQLGIEALKFTLAVRGTILHYATLPLPGETKE